MKELFSIRSREVTYRIIIVILGLVAMIVPIFALNKAHKTIEKSKEEIYVLLGDKAIVSARTSNLYNSLEVLCKGQVEDINKLIFEHVPDDEEINRRLKRAEYLSDKATQNVIDMQQQNQFYNNMVNQDYYTLLQTDSLYIDYSLEPFYFDYKGTLSFIRNKKEVRYFVETEGKLEMMGAVTENNSRGIKVRDFYIKNFKKEN